MWTRYRQEVTVKWRPGLREKLVLVRKVEKGLQEGEQSVQGPMAGMGLLC